MLEAKSIRFSLLEAEKWEGDSKGASAWDNKDNVYWQ